VCVTEKERKDPIVTETPLLIVDRVGGVTVARLARPLRLTGEMAGALGEQLSSLVEDGSRCLLVNLADVEVLTSLMLGNITALDKALRTRGGYLALCSPRPVIREILDLVGLTARVCVYQTEQEGLQGLLAHESCA
jgi:anti-anti-sigma factor